MSEIKQSVQERKVTKENRKMLKPGVYFIEDTNYIPRSELKKEDVKKFQKVKINVTSTFRQGKQDRINFKVFPCVAVKGTEVLQGLQVKAFSDLIVLNSDASNNIRLTRNSYVSLLINSKMNPVIEDKEFNLIRYARFITSEKDGRRHYRMQLFLSFEHVETLWINELVVDTMSKLVQSGLIDPITFYQATNEELELDKPIQVDLI